MPGLLREIREDDPLDRPRTMTLMIRGEPYANAAAKFWPGLIDELREDFPECSLIELTAPTARRLDREQLYPEMALQKSFDELLTARLDTAMKNLLAEIEMLGPPCAVQARLFRGREEMVVRDLPLDSVDAETFSYLVAWHLEWARIPPARWNEASLSGRLTGEDRQRRLAYHMTFSLTNRHLSEGLFRRSLSVVPVVKPL